jgi:hypothetical protein
VPAFFSDSLLKFLAITKPLRLLSPLTFLGGQIYPLMICLMVVTDICAIGSRIAVPYSQRAEVPAEKQVEDITSNSIPIKFAILTA